MAEGRSETERSTVLVLEEDPELADRFTEWLAGRYDVQVVRETAAAVEILGTGPDAIDAVVLDCRTVEESIDLVLVSFHDAGVDCPVGLVTDERPDVDLIDEGFDDYLVAPVSQEGLLRSIDGLLRVEGQEALRRELSTKRVRRNVLDLERSEGKPSDNEAFARLDRDIEQLERRLSLHRERLKGTGENEIGERGETAVRT